MPATKHSPGWRTYAKVVGAFALALGALTLAPGILSGEETSDVLWISGIATALGLLCLLGGFGKLRKRRLIRNTPTSKIRSLAVGDVEVNGRARPLAEPALSPISHQRACLYEFEVEEKHEDDDGSDWKTVLEIREHVPFAIDDGTGSVPVQAEQADLHVEREERVHVDAQDPPPEPVRAWATETGRLDGDEVDEEGGFVDAVGDSLSSVTGGEADQHLGGTSLHDRRYTESVLAVDEESYVFGGAQPREGVSSSENAENLVIGPHEGTGEFIVSDRTESDLLDGLLVASAVFLALALFLVPTGILGFLTVAGVV